jgi:hypothetical protein
MIYVITIIFFVKWIVPGKNSKRVTAQAMGFNPRILIFYPGEARVKYQNSGVFPASLSSYQSDPNRV